jgi:hypothetical protein
MAVFQDSAWQPAKEMSMEAHLSMAPSGDTGIVNRTISGNEQNRNGYQESLAFRLIGLCSVSNKPFSTDRELSQCEQVQVLFVYWRQRYAVCL